MEVPPSLVALGECAIEHHVPFVLTFFGFSGACDTYRSLSGGLEAKGHPLGATGLGMHFYIACQLRRIDCLRTLC